MITFNSMNVKRAKRIALEEFLVRLGFLPSHQGDDQLWYLSPLRNERTPSFKVRPSLNLWYDFGSGEGGSIIDFVMRFERLDCVSAALRRIALIEGQSPLPPYQPPAVIQRQTITPMKLKSIAPVNSASLIAYLKERGIRCDLAASYVKEALYCRGIHAYAALAFANDSGGYELRSPAFKGTFGAKDITTFRGSSERVIVLEGFFDFLSLVAMRGAAPKATVVVLNSVSMRRKAAKVISALSPHVMEVFRDHDRAGEDLLAFFQRELQSIQILDRSACYSGFDDLNHWYVAQQPIQLARL